LAISDPRHYWWSICSPANLLPVPRHRFVDADFFQVVLNVDRLRPWLPRAEKAKVHTMLVIGGRDMNAGQVSVRLHSKGPQGTKPKGEVVAEILQRLPIMGTW
jgi:hypothetical protein